MNFQKMVLKLFLAYLITLSSIENIKAQDAMKPLRLAVVGTTHGHVPWILGRKDKKDITLVGIYEKDTALAKRLMKDFNLNPTLFFTDLNKMLERVKPEAVVAFGSTYDHLAAVEACAPKGIHVMVEKPLATTYEAAKKMERLAKANNIHLLTNYETSWYPTTEKTYGLVRDSNAIGRLTKAVFHHGHSGPAKIGVQPQFLNWLIDPVQNGGGALMDFGCYGANIMTYLMRGEAPVSVTAITKNFQPALYPKVEDEATIIVNYPNAQCIIQASWNWPFNRKDMEVYGETGYVITKDNDDLIWQNQKLNQVQQLQIKAADVGVYTDPFTFLYDVVRGKIKVAPHSLYSLDNNMMVVRILDAARESAKTGKTIFLAK